MDIDVMYDEPNRGPLDCMTEWDAFPERYEEYLAEQRIKSMVSLAGAVILLVIDTIVITRSKKKGDKHNDESTST